MAELPFAPVAPQAAPGLPQTDPHDRPLMGNVQFHVANGDTEGLADEHMLLSDLRHAGYTPTGVSADGMTITLQGAEGDYQVRTTDVLNKLGWQVKAATPKNVDYDHVDMGLRLGIESPGLREDDHAKESFLKARLSRAGIHDPQIIGGGSDWFVFNPESQQYIALTIKEGMDLSDLGEVGARAPGMIGSTAGAIGGAFTGPAAPVAMPGLSAAGGFAGNRLADAMTGWAMPEAEEAMSQRPMMARGKEWLQEAGADAIGGLAGYGIGKLGTAGAQVLGRGLVSRGAAEAGSAMQPVGRAVGATAKAFDNGTVGGEFLKATLDPTGMTMASDIGQIPAQAIRGGARGIGKFGESPMLNEFMPNATARAREISRRLLTRTAEQPEMTLGEHVTSRMHPGAAEKAFPGIGAEEVLGNAGRMMGGTGETAATVGRGIDTMGTVSKLAGKPVSAVYGAGIKGVQAAGRAAEYGGRGLKAAGEALGPYEVPGLLHGGSDELLRKLRERQRALHLQGYDRNIAPDESPTTLVSNP